MDHDADEQTYVIESDDWQETIEIQDTPVGHGLFATTMFPEDSIVGEITGEKIFDNDYESDYCLWLGGNEHLEPEAPFRFLNHSCDANCDFDVFELTEYTDFGEPIVRDAVMVFATRKILPGEELTIDYCWPADAAIPCQCGAENCRGWVVDVDELALVKARNSNAS